MDLFCFLGTYICYMCNKHSIICALCFFTNVASSLDVLTML